MMRRRKDSGFTLIELMIVIAVIGILAIVLIPKVGTIKTQAKESGLDTNVRIVQGYVESKISKWASSKTLHSTAVSDIKTAFDFSSDPSKQLVNPITSLAGNATSSALADLTGGTPSVDKEPVIVLSDNSPVIDKETLYPNIEGSILVAISGGDSDSAPITAVKIYAYTTGGKQLSEKTVTITP